MRIFSLLFVFILVAGCGGEKRPELAPVTGMVTFNGEPIADATVTFHPENGRPATGKTNADGIYVLTTFEEGDGAVIGNHKVAILKVTGNTDSSLPEDLAKIESIIPDKYSLAKSSGLTATVTAGQDAPIDFNLAD